MLGAIAGDIIGSVYEGKQASNLDFPLFIPRSRFTDDSVLTVAVADALLTGTDYGEKLHQYYSLYPDAGYGGGFKRWGASPNPQPYNSFGNGSAMRVSPIAYAFDDLDTMLVEAGRSAEVTHNHPEGIKGAQIIAAAIFLARLDFSKHTIQKELEQRFGVQPKESYRTLHAEFRFDVTCQGSVPQALTAFFQSDSFEDAIRKAVYIGGDSDTLACMAGAVAEAYYGGVPQLIQEKVFSLLDDRLASVVQTFYTAYAPGRITLPLH